MEQDELARWVLADSLGFRGPDAVWRVPDPLCAQVRWIAVDRLGDRVSRVMVALLDYEGDIALGIVSAEGWMHAVRSPLPFPREGFDAVEWTGRACDKLLAWLDAKAAGAGAG